MPPGQSSSFKPVEKLEFHQACNALRIQTQVPLIQLESIRQGKQIMAPKAEKKPAAPAKTAAKKGGKKGSKKKGASLFA